jgi:hypothetical protein
MRKAALVLFSVFLVSGVCAETRAESLAVKVRKADFLDGKRAAALELAALGGPESLAALESLLEDDDPWTGGAAFEALLSLGVPSIDDRMVRRYASDSFLRSLSERAFMKRGRALVASLERIYRSEEGESSREEIIDIAGSIEGGGAEAFLRSVIDDAASPLRSEALRAYASMRRSADAEYMRKLAADAVLEPMALSRLAEIGGQVDLPLFEAAFARKGGKGGRVAAMGGIARFAPEKRKRSAFLEALGSGDEGLAEASLSVFGTLRSEGLMAAAAALVVSENPFLALRAALYVASYDVPEALPLAVPGLKAEYAEARSMPRFFDWFANLITLGLSGLMDDYNRLRNRREFDAEKAKLAKRLSAIAKTDLGPDYEAWEEHAVLSGWCVGGANILQYLFSAESGLRSRARKAAVSLLGFRDEAAFASDFPGYAGFDDIGRGIALASRLEKKGYPKLWK